MVKRKSNLPPFEVMRGSVAPPLDDASQQVDLPEGYEGPGAPQGAPPPPPEDWLGRLKHPVVLRVPRGYIALVVIGFIGLIVLGYVVGHRQGKKLGKQEANALAENQGKVRYYESLGPPREIRRFVPPDDPNNGGAITKGNGNGRGGVRPNNGRPNRNGTGSNGANGNDPDGDGQVDPPPPTSGWPPKDIREVGLNYMVLSRSPEDEARRLMAFLAGFGVNTTATRDGNSNFYLVHAVDNGFSKGTLDSEEAKAYFGKLRSLGRDWKRHNNNRGHDLNDMYPAKFDGP